MSYIKMDAWSMFEKHTISIVIIAVMATTGTTDADKDALQNANYDHDE